MDEWLAGVIDSNATKTRGTHLLIQTNINQEIMTHLFAVDIIATNEADGLHISDKNSLAILMRHVEKYLRDGDKKQAIKTLIDSRNGNGRLHPSLIPYIANLRKTGYTWTQVANRLHVTRQALHRFREKHSGEVE